MKTFYNETGGVIGRACAALRCNSTLNHGPHIHNPETAMYGPYACPGGGAYRIPLYDTPPRRAVCR